MPCLLTNRRTSGLRAAHRMNRRSTALVARLSGIGRTLSAAADGLPWTVVSDALTVIERTIFRFERNFLSRPSLADRKRFAYSPTRLRSAGGGGRLPGGRAREEYSG